MKSLFVIMIGPAGSGKGYIEGYIRNHFKKSPIEINPDNFEYALIDDYIEIDGEYINNVIAVTSELIQNDGVRRYITKLGNYEHCLDQINNYVENKDVDTVNKINMLDDYSVKYTQLYFSARKKYDVTLDDNLAMWLSLRKNIIFETTGNNSLDWLFTSGSFLNQYNINDYIVCMAYPYVTNEVILSRSLHRFASRVCDFVYYHDNNQTDIYYELVKNKVLVNKNQILKPPRYVQLFGSKYSLEQTISSIQANIANYIERCDVNNNNYIDVFLIYDNRKNMPLLKYDLSCKHKQIYCADITDSLENEKVNNKFKKVLIDISEKCRKNE